MRKGYYNCSTIYFESTVPQYYSIYIYSTTIYKSIGHSTTTMLIPNHLPKGEEPANRRRDRGQLVCSEEEGLAFSAFGVFGFRVLGV